MYPQSEKNLLNSNISPTCPYNMVNWDRFVSLGPPANFNGFRVLAVLLHGTVVVGISETAGFQFRPNLAWWRSSTFLRRLTVKKFKFFTTQDGSDRHLQMSKKSPYLGDGWTYRHKIWHADAVWPSWPFCFENRAPVVALRAIPNILFVFYSAPNSGNMHKLYSAE